MATTTAKTAVARHTEPEGKKGFVLKDIKCIEKNIDNEMEGDEVTWNPRNTRCKNMCGNVDDDFDARRPIGNFTQP